MSTISRFYIFSFSFRRNRTPVGKHNDCTLRGAAQCLYLYLIKVELWLTKLVEAGFVASMGVMDWPSSSASLAAVQQLGVVCSDPRLFTPHPHPHPQPQPPPTPVSSRCLAHPWSYHHGLHAKLAASVSVQAWVLVDHRAYSLRSPALTGPLVYCKWQRKYYVRVYAFIYKYI